MWYVEKYSQRWVPQDYVQPLRDHHPCGQTKNQALAVKWSHQKILANPKDFDLWVLYKRQLGPGLALGPLFLSSKWWYLWKITLLFALFLGECNWCISVKSLKINQRLNQVITLEFNLDNTIKLFPLLPDEWLMFACRGIMVAFTC